MLREFVCLEGGGSWVLLLWKGWRGGLFFLLLHSCCCNGSFFCVFCILLRLVGPVLMWFFFNFFCVVEGCVCAFIWNCICFAWALIARAVEYIAYACNEY
jgi:hypothetical protein